MSGLVTGLVLDRYPHGGGELLVAIALADNAHRDGTNIFPGVDEVAARTKLSRRAVQLHMAKMVASGWLVLVRKSTGRRGDTNEYRISPEWLAGGESVPPAEPVLRTNAKGVKARSGGANSAPHANVDKSGAWGEASDTVGCKKHTHGVKPSSPKPPEPSGNHTPQPPAEAGGGGQMSPKSEQPKSKPPKPDAADRARWRWTENRRTIEERGQQLGLGTWDEAALGRGGEIFTVYTARVYVAHLRSLGCEVDHAAMLRALGYEVGENALLHAVKRHPGTDAELLREMASTHNENDDERGPR